MNLRQLIDRELLSTFRPEFLNRLDDTIVFQSLRKEELAQIVDLQIKGLNKILSDRRLQIELTHSAQQFLAEAGWDPAFGARPLKRAVQKHLQDALAMQLLEGRLKEGERILVDRGENGLELRAAEEAKA